MNSDLDSLLKGIQLLLGVQLVVVAILHWIARVSMTKVWLSVLCLIHGLWFFKHVFTDSWDNSFLLFLLIGPGKPIFVGSVLLFYYQTLGNSFNGKKLLPQLLIPGIYYMTLIAVRYFLAEGIPVDRDLFISTGFSFWALIIFWYYFLITRKELIHRTSQVLIRKAYLRVRALFYSLYFFLLQIPVWDILYGLSKHDLFPGSLHWLDVVGVQYFVQFGYYSSQVYIHILGYFVFIYAAIELPYLKKYLLPRQTMIKKSVLENRERLDAEIERVLYENKAYKDPDLTIDSCASILQITRNELADYLQLTRKVTFKDLVNQLRVDEIKRLMADKEFAKYDLVGIAMECGFGSKSTFHRVFKEKEGMTPKEYQMKQNAEAQVAI